MAALHGGLEPDHKRSRGRPAQRLPALSRRVSRANVTVRSIRWRTRS
ncbi:hypothetical protein NB721_002819 [Xanthomonas sacchari]|nr:hypothetical protein [Xanthomonas sacchari]